MSDFRLIFSRPVLETKVFDVSHDRAEHPSGAALDRHVIHNAPSAVMCPRRPDGAILLIRQYRLPIRQALWELPAGRCNKDEPVLETAKRELIEETGYRAAKWTKLFEFHPAPAIATELMTAFLAEDLTEGASAPEDYELIETRWTPWEDVLPMVREGRIRDAKSIATLLYFATFGIAS